MTRKNIVLIGMMGSGKSTIAKALSERLRIPLYSTDDAIEHGTQRKIKDLVAAKDWEHFRYVEHRAVRQLVHDHKGGVVIDCGGGVVLNPDNLKLLRENGIIFYLSAPPFVLYQRLKGDLTRPLIQVADPQAELEKLHAERLPLYEQADHVIDASDASIEGPIAQILAKV